MSAGPLRIAVMVDRFPTLSETFVTTEITELRRLGHRVRVEAVEPAETPNWPAAAGVPVAFAAHETRRTKLRDLLWLVAHHPLGCARDLAGRRAWRAEEDVSALRTIAGRARRITQAGTEVVHVHFAARSALEALRLGRILGLPWTLTAHAYDIFAFPTNLEAKLAAAAWTTTGCAYNVRALQARSPAPGRVVEVVMGVDPERFARSTPLPAGRTVVAVGRLVEKKGLRHLLDACALLAARGDGVERLVLVGEGAERAALERRVAELGLEDVVTFAGALDPAGVRRALEAADVLAMPAVVARDGDRDSMPVVVKEAMAMELLVAASDEVGLPEVVRAPWGRLAPPGDAAALADALAALLALPADERARAGAAARAWVLEHASSAEETARLAELLRAARDGGALAPPGPPPRR